MAICQLHIMYLQTRPMKNKRRNGRSVPSIMKKVLLMIMVVLLLLSLKSQCLGRVEHSN